MSWLRRADIEDIVQRSKFTEFRFYLAFDKRCTSLKDLILDAQWFYEGKLERKREAPNLTRTHDL